MFGKKPKNIDERRGASVQLLIKVALRLTEVLSALFDFQFAFISLGMTYLPGKSKTSSLLREHYWRDLNSSAALLCHSLIREKEVVGAIKPAEVRERFNVKDFHGASELVSVKEFVGAGECVRNGERGDVPGWVLVVLMTAGLVTGIWTVAAPRLNTLLRSSLDSMNAIR